MRYLIFTLFLASFTLVGDSYANKDYSFVRVFERAKQDVKWQEAQTLTERLWLIRKYSAKHAVTSDPVSDRYVVTCYGGTIDLVHFLCLAANVSSGKHERAPRLYQEWLAEGGKENLYKFNYSEHPEAHPDDLPSNALGALFGLELRKHDKDLSVDLQKAFTDFVAPLLPVKDEIAKAFSHREIVMGLPEKPSKKLYEERHGWFTAAPLLHIKKLNAKAIEKRGKPLCKFFKDGRQALKEAGFVLYGVRKRPILISRLRAAS